MVFERDGEKQDKERGLRFGFNVEKYRPGVPVVRDWSGIVSEAVREAYGEVPPVVWLMVRRLYVTGVAGTATQMRAQLRFKVQRDVAEDLIALYFSKHAEELEQERNAYLEQLHRAGLEEELAMGANPALERYHRVAANLGVLLDALVGEAIEEGTEFTPNELRTLTSTLSQLQDGDPLVRMRMALAGSKPDLSCVTNPKSVPGDAVDDAVSKLRKLLENSTLGHDVNERLAKYEERSNPDEEGDKDG